MLRRASSIPPLLRSSFHPLQRPFSSKVAEFITLNAQGSYNTRKVDVWVGDAGSAFVLVPTDVGNAIRAGCASKQGGSFEDSEQHSLTFYHGTNHFTPKFAQYPQLRIPQCLRNQTKTDTSLATLHLFGTAHTITLDGTPDADFAEKSQDTWAELKPVLDSLKDR